MAEFDRARTILDEFKGDFDHHGPGVARDRGVNRDENRERGRIACLVRNLSKRDNWAVFKSAGRPGLLLLPLVENTELFSPNYV